MSINLNGSGEATPVVPHHQASHKSTPKKRNPCEQTPVCNSEGRAALGSALKLFQVSNAPLKNSLLAVSSASGITARTNNGKAAQLAIVDGEGKVLEIGQVVANEVWNLTIEFYSEILANTGVVKVQSKPPGAIVV